MSKQEKKALVPVLRFPQFRDSPGWSVKSFEEGFTRLTTKNSENNQNVLTISAQQGLVSQLEYFNKQVAAKDLSGYYLLHKGDFAYNKSYSQGYPMGAIKPLKLYDKGVVSTLYICFRTNKGFVDSFFEQYFEAGLLNSEIGKIAQEGGRAHGLLNVSVTEFFRNLNLLAPELEEQQKIADCLTSIDNLITAQTQKIDSLKAHKKGLMQQLFPAEGETMPKLRFPEFRNKEEWQVKTLDELFTIGNGRDYKHLATGDVPVYGSGGYMLSVNDYLYDGESVCIGRKGTIDNPIFLTGKFWTVDTLFYTHSFKNCLPRFIYAIFQQVNWINHNEAGGVPSLSKTNIGKIEVTVPKPDEQQKIVDCLTSVDELITAQTQKVDALKAHKKGLMQQLFPAMDEVDA